MSFSTSVIEIPLRLQGVLRLAVIPRSACVVETVEGTLDEPRSTLVIKGSCENVPDKTPCHVLLARDVDPSLSPQPLGRVPGLEESDDRLCEMKVSGGRFEVTVEIDVLAMALVGKGKLLLTVKPDQAGCESSGTGKVPFDHQISFACAPEAPALMGTLVTLTPTTTGLFSSAPIRLTIEEYDRPDSAEAQGESAGKDWRLDLDWAGDDRSARSLRLGCTEHTPASGDTPALVALSYPEPNEIPPYEFAYTIKTMVGDRERPLYKERLFAPAVPKPTVSTFEIALVEPPATEERPDGEKELRVKLGLDGFADDISFAIQITLWRAVTGGGGEITLEDVQPITDSVFVPSLRVQELSCATSLHDITSCFAVLSFPGAAGATVPGAQVGASTIVECGDAFFTFEPPEEHEPGWLWEAHWAPAAATGVASREANAEVLKKLRAYKGVTAAQLQAIMPAAQRADIDTFVVPLNRAMQEFDIDTLPRQRAFIAQIAHESGCFKYKEEIHDGSNYEGRSDLGNTQTGDGKRYKGRGLIQLTGRANYRTTGAALGLSLESDPMLIVRDPVVSARVSAYFFKSRGLNELADAGNFREITYRVNGGYRGEAERNAFHETAKKVIL